MNNMYNLPKMNKTHIPNRTHMYNKYTIYTNIHKHIQHIYKLYTQMYQNITNVYNMYKYTHTRGCPVGRQCFARHEVTKQRPPHWAKTTTDAGNGKLILIKANITVGNGKLKLITATPTSGNGKR